MKTMRITISPEHRRSLDAVQGKTEIIETAIHNATADPESLGSALAHRVHRFRHRLSVPVKAEARPIEFVAGPGPGPGTVAAQGPSLDQNSPEGSEQAPAWVSTSVRVGDEITQSLQTLVEALRLSKDEVVRLALEAEFVRRRMEGWVRD